MTRRAVTSRRRAWPVKVARALRQTRAVASRKQPAIRVAKGGRPVEREARTPRPGRPMIRAQAKALLRASRRSRVSRLSGARDAGVGEGVKGSWDIGRHLLSGGQDRDRVRTRD